MLLNLFKININWTCIGLLGWKGLLKVIINEEDILLGGDKGDKESKEKLNNIEGISLSFLL